MRTSQPAPPIPLLLDRVCPQCPKPAADLSVTLPRNTAEQQPLVLVCHRGHLRAFPKRSVNSHQNPASWAWEGLPGREMSSTPKENAAENIDLAAVP